MFLSQLADAGDDSALLARDILAADNQREHAVEDGLVVRTIFPELPPRSEYSITELGASLIPIIDAMLAWGEKNSALFEAKYSHG